MSKRKIFRPQKLCEKPSFKPSAHFNEPGHRIEHMKVIAIEKLKNKNTQYRKEKEKFFIQKFDSYHNGINKRP